MKIVQTIIRALEKFIKAVSIFDGFLIIALMLMIGVDIVLRMFGKSITGSVEIATMIVPVIVFLGVGYTALQEMHIRVDIIKRWPNLDRFTNLLCIVAIICVGYHCCVQAMQVKDLATSSTILQIPRWPFVLVTGFGMFMVSLAMLLNEIKAWINIFQNRKNKKLGISPAPDAE